MTKKIAIENLFPNKNPFRADDDLTALLDSIKKEGLLHPIKVYELSKMGNYGVLEGFRRIEAYRQLGFKEIFAKIVAKPDNVNLERFKANLI